MNIPNRHNAIEILHVTDTHLFADLNGALLGCVTDASLLRVLDHVQRMAPQPDLVIATGDLVHDESHEGYRRLCDRLAVFGVPMFAIPGNHDSPEIMSELYRDGPMRFCSHLQRGNWQFFLLNTYRCGAVGGTVDPVALMDISRRLEMTPSAYAVIAMHHHPVPIQSPWLDAIGVDNAGLFNEFVLSQPRIRAVIWGHIHQEWDEQRGQVRYLGTPSTCVQFAPRLERMALDSRLPGVRWITLFDDGRLEARVIRVEEFAKD